VWQTQYIGFATGTVVSGQSPTLGQRVVAPADSTAGGATLTDVSLATLGNATRIQLLVNRLAADSSDTLNDVANILSIDMYYQRQ